VVEIAGDPSLSQNEMTEKAKEKNTIFNLVSSGNIVEALDTLLSMELPAKDKVLVAQIKASFENLQRESRKGVLSFEQETTERNRITDRLLRVLNGDESDPKSFKTKHRDRKWWEYIIRFGILMGILGGIAEFSGWNLMKLLDGSGSDDTFTVTVFVHGKKGKFDRILKDQGQVMLGVRTNEMSCSINEKGEATFKEIAIGFKGQKVPIRIEHSQPYLAIHPDSLYTLEPNAAIYLEIALEGTDRVFGKVMDFNTEQWLDSVRVSIENQATFTDKFGWFELYIPKDKQRKYQRVSFFKNGYKIEELDSIPVHTQKEIQISLHKSKK